MTDLSNMTPEELEQILGSDYATTIADALRRKQNSEADPSPSRSMGQMANGHVAFDPGYAIEKYANRYRQAKEGKTAQGDLDKALAAQKQGRRAYADVLARGPAAPPQPPVPSMAAAGPDAGPTHAPIPPPPPPPAAPPPAPMPPPTAGGPPGLGPMPAGEPLRGAPAPATAAPPLANASTMNPASLAAAGVPPAVIQQILAKLRGG